ncbi:MAG: hypothetical protein N2Z65_05045 [Clostridiales bacterium]|nr:hypothetical protein [Clostridiales bacterium]
MTATIGGIIVAVTAAAIASSIASSFAGVGALREITRIAGSLLIILALITPFAKKGNLFDFNIPTTQMRKQIEGAAKTGAEKEEKLVNSTVATKISQYIEEKAKSTYGIDLNVSFESVIDKDGVFAIRSAEIKYDKKPTMDQIKKVGALIEKECGLKFELQEHKGG